MNMASSPILMLIMIFSMWLLISYSESTEYVVGNSQNLWKVHLPSRHALTQWASSHQFIDTIMFDRDNKVNEDENIKCNTKSHSKMGLKLDDDVVVKSKPLVMPPLITLPEPPSPAPAPNSSGSNGGAAGRGLVMLFGVSSLAMIMFLI
ncbi:hypothetical protein TSUD_201970 [Trifolium subterraneum]|uniref:Phytocyanin domain-containing protein n=1 Tax=Trifolium subterraneum TaxID=3900 RepID=A0A2Z6LKI7_TRISU|nr:hypothetical protein TSUD_201970 [Trifolium subterraneum]